MTVYKLHVYSFLLNKQIYFAKLYTQERNRSKSYTVSVGIFRILHSCVLIINEDMCANFRCQYPAGVRTSNCATFLLLVKTISITCKIPYYLDFRTED